MLNKLIKFSWKCILCLFLAACTSGGNVSEVKRSISFSTLYQNDEINDAMNVATKHFKTNFKGCTLTELTYDEGYSLTQAEGWARQYNAFEAIVLTSSFDVDASGGDGTLNPNQSYDNWQWILTREKEGKWILKTWGN